jgi:hypothetical protein
MAKCGEDVKLMSRPYNKIMGVSFAGSSAHVARYFMPSSSSLLGCLIPFRLIIYSLIIYSLMIMMIMMKIIVVCVLGE